MFNDDFHTCFQDKFDVEKAGEESDQQYVLFPMWSSGSTNPQNTDGDVAFDGKEPEFDERSMSLKLIFLQAVLLKFEDFSNNSINEVNAAGTLVPTIGQDKYAAEILRKFRLTDGKSTSTPKDMEKPLLKDPDGGGMCRGGSSGGDGNAAGAVHLARRSPTKGGDSESNGDGDGVGMARSLSTSASGGKDMPA
nr:hypothetical protein [Tanacetum cinerariifolium]